MERALSPLSERRVETLELRQWAGADRGEAGKRYRTPGQRDRDRVLYCSALQRLAYITQVTASESGHTFHNRLSHSLKVAQVARRNTEHLKKLVSEKHISGAAATLVDQLDVDAVEASSLGHPPYLEAFTLRNKSSGAISLQIDDDALRQVNALRMLVWVYVVRHPGLAVVQHGQRRVIRDLFEWYFDASDPGESGDRRLFPPGARERLEDGDDSPSARARVVLDLIAGLSENAAIQLHRRLFGGGVAPTLDATALIG